MADNGKLTVSSIELKAGELQQVAVNLNNDSKKYAAFQYDFTLPEGITIAKNNKGELMINLNADRIGDHTLTVQDLGSGSYRLLCFSMTNAEFSGTSGALVNMTLKADDNVSIGTKEGVFKSPVFTEADGSQEKWADVTFNIFVMPDVIPEVTADDKTREYGEDNPTFEFTSEGAALDGTPEITCEATATSPVGTYLIVIKKGDVKNYNDTYVNGVLTITKAPLTITAKNYTIKQGEALPTFEAEYSGFKNNDTEAVLTMKPTFSCSAVVGSEPGTYDITVSGAEAQNYEMTYVAGKLIVDQADPVTVTAKSYTREYGEANPMFEYTSEGAELNGSPEITCEATESSPVGTYLIVIKKGDVTNYNDTYVNGVLTITKAPLTVKVEDATREQYLENPEFVITYTGWKVGDDESVLTKKPTAMTTATEDSPVGLYDIVVSGGEAENYELSYQNGVLTVTESTGIATISTKNPVDIYTLQGHKVRTKATTLEGLPKGVYIVNGRKVVVKK